MGCCEEEDKRSVKKGIMPINEEENFKFLFANKSLCENCNSSSVIRKYDYNKNNNKEISINNWNFNINCINNNINLNYFARENDFQRNAKFCEISGILKLSLLKYISNITKDMQFERIKNENMKQILVKLKNSLDLKNKGGFIENEEKLPNDIQTILKEKEGNNIMEYTKYINSTVKDYEIEELFEIFTNEQKQNIEKFVNSLIKYEKYNNYFEEHFIKAQKESIFDYSMVNLVIIDSKKFNIYENAKNKCQNCAKKYFFMEAKLTLFHK